MGHGSHSTHTRNRLLGVTLDGQPFTVGRNGARLAFTDRDGEFASRAYEEPAEGLYVAAGTEGRSWWLNCDPLGGPTTCVCWVDGRPPRSHRVEEGGHVYTLLAHNGQVFCQATGSRRWPNVNVIDEDACASGEPGFMRVEPPRHSAWRHNVQLTLVPAGDRVLGFSAQVQDQQGVVGDNPPYFVIEPNLRAEPLAMNDESVWGEDLMVTQELAGRRFRVGPQVQQGFETPAGIVLVTTNGLFVLDAVGERPRRVIEQADGAHFAFDGRVYSLQEARLAVFDGDGYRTVREMQWPAGHHASGAAFPDGSLVAQFMERRRQADGSEAWDVAAAVWPAGTVGDAAR